MNLEEKAKNAILQQDQKKIAKILEKLKELQKKELEGKIQEIEKFSESQSLFTFLSPSRRVFLFGKEDQIQIFFYGKIFPTDVKVPDEVFSSFSGEFWIFRYKQNHICQDVFYSLKISKERSEFQQIKEFAGVCNPIVITDTGNIYELKDQKEVWNKITSTVALRSNQFPKLFKKNSSYMYFFPVPEKGFWIFYGNIGYYELFYFNEKSLRLVYKGIALPKVYYAIYELFQEHTSSENYYFVFTGGAGQYSLTGFRLPDELWKSFNVEYKENYVYITNQDYFLYSDEDSLYLLNPKTSKEIQLPIYLNDYFVYDNYLIFLTHQGLYLRKEPFSNLERKIFLLKEELLYSIR